MAVNGFIGAVPYVILTFPKEREIFIDIKLDNNIKFTLSKYLY